MTDEFYAGEAKRLLEDQVLLKAISDAQMAAMMALVSIDPFNANAIAEQQARVKAFDDVLTQLQMMVVKTMKQAEIAVP